MPQEKPALLVITGPTATGKTSAGIEAALRLNGEIVSADSMMVYRGMDVGTAKPTAAEMKGVPHHLIDVVDPDEDFSVACYQELAEKHIQEISARGKLPILVGGTGLYVRAVLDHYHFVVGPDRALRRELQDAARARGVAWLHGQLAGVDPVSAQRLHPNNVRRVIRALEVYYRTGRPLSSFQDRDHKTDPKYRTLVFGLICDRDEMYRRIEKRVDEMLAAGLVEEVRRLINRGYERNLPSMKGLGYKEIAAYLAGETGLDEAVETLKRNTRRFAKRQLTWFRRDERIIWLDVVAAGGPAGAAKEIVTEWQEYQRLPRNSFAFDRNDFQRDRGQYP
ncbi:tRNA (adenosine(37)-N6)-dimethylallyltransferase MiaA [Desulforudis sp. 1088]|uniref:tRNA (adenosine(37)-N6)-dimethylallyltransferase MiaA n=1 Tax=unclassified Candidatus Desulforudis TaxID=2635950 RepID=UPI00346E0C4B